MAANQKTISNLPNALDNGTIEIISMEPAAWPHVQQLAASDCSHFIPRIYGNDTAPDKHAHLLQHKDGYEWLCRDVLAPGMFAHPEYSQLAFKRYWICAPHNSEIVGDMSSGILARHPDILLVGIGTLPQHQGLGYASAAIRLMSDYTLGNKIIKYVVAECDLENTASAKTMLRAGFREIAAGLCTTLPEHPNNVRRFMKTHTKTDVWPLLSFT